VICKYTVKHVLHDLAKWHEQARTLRMFGLLQWQLRMDAPELAYGKTLAIFLHKIELGKRQPGRNLRYFS